MVRSVLMTSIGVLVSACLASPAFSQTLLDQKIAYEKKKQRDREKKAKQDSTKESTVLFVRLVQEANFARVTVSPANEAKPTITLPVQAPRDDSGRPELDHKLVELAKVLTPGKKIRITTQLENGLTVLASITLLDDKGKELSKAATAQYIEDHYAWLFEKYTESLVSQKPQMAVTLSRSGTSDTFTVIVTRDAQGVWAPALAVVARVRTLKQGEKVEFRLLPDSKILRSIRRKDDPEQGNFLAYTEKDGNKAGILQFRDASGVVDSFLVKDSRIAAKARQIQLGQGVEYRTKTEGNQVIVTYLSLAENPIDRPVGIRGLGEKPPKLQAP